MRLIDIDRLKSIESLIHYIKKYEGSVVLMDNMMKIKRDDIKFSIEYKPIGGTNISLTYDNKEDLAPLEDKIRDKITKMDESGILANIL